MLHKFGLESHRADLAESVCVPESTRAGSPVRDCSGFAIANYVRFVFAKCQAPCFCFYRGRIGNRASEVPLRDARAPLRAAVRNMFEELERGELVRGKGKHGWLPRQHICI
jgi:hypothetical protein